MNDASSRTKKFLLPLAVLLAAGALAVGSGATFTSTTSNTASVVTAGTLTQSNSKDGQAIFTASNLKPGDVVKGSLTISNTGSLPAAFSLTETESTNGFSGANLNLVITNTTTGAAVYQGTFGGLVDGEKQSLGDFAPGDSADYEFVATLVKETPNTDQGASASATYTWDAVQLGN